MIGVSVCTCTFKIPSSIIHTIESPNVSNVERISNNLSSSFGSFSSINISVQYPKTISSGSIGCSSVCLNSSKFSLIVTSSPLRLANIPSKIAKNPAPPLSTTPTSFKTGNNSGVLSNDSLALSYKA